MYFSSLFVLSKCDGRGVMTIQNRPLKKRDQQNQKHQTRKCLTALSGVYIPARADTILLGLYGTPLLGNVTDRVTVQSCDLSSRPQRTVRSGRSGFSTLRKSVKLTGANVI